MPYWLEQIFRKKELEQNSVYVGDITSNDHQARILICLFRGLLVFMASYATIIGVLDCFELPFNRPVVIGFLLFISMTVALLYLHKLLFYVGYFAILAIFTRQLLYYYLYANSGFQAISNVIFEKYSDFYKLDFLREAEEIYTNRYETITIAVFFIGTFLALLLNVTISGYMNTLETIMITFPFLEIGFYIFEKPPLHCVLLLLSVYLTVAILQYSKNFKMQVKSKRTKEFIRRKFKKTHFFTYQTNLKGQLFALLLSVGLVFVLGICASPLYNLPHSTYQPNAIRTEADNLIKIYLQNGIGGLFDRYDTKGGVSSNGRLGGVSSVRPDFQTDLIVTFAPYSYETIYLKGYTGSQYYQSQWLSHAYTDASTNNPQIFMTDKNIKTYDNLYLPQSGRQAKMLIENVDAYENEVLLPYYAESEETRFPVGETMNIGYYPYLFYDYEGRELTIPEDYDEYIHTYCLQVPEELKWVLQSYCHENELGENFNTDIEILEDIPAEDRNDYINEQRRLLAYEVYSHFIKDYDYTMAPGSTPVYYDFVDYFLNYQKRGYCVHFASSAVLLLRSMGVPCRYVEGYCVPATLMAEGELVPGENISDWYKGPHALEEQGVIQVEVNDSYAHAWIEIYMEGYGFIPFEITPADLDSDMGIPNLAGLFSGLFDIDFNMADAPDEQDDTIRKPEDALKRLFPTLSAAKILLPLLLFISGILLAVIIIQSSHATKKSKRRKEWLQKKKYAYLIHENYMKFSNVFYKRITTASSCKNVLKPSSHNLLPDELCKLATNCLFIVVKNGKKTTLTEQDIEFYRLNVTLGMYSLSGITLKEYNELVRIEKELYKLCKLLK